MCYMYYRNCSTASTTAPTTRTRPCHLSDSTSTSRRCCPAPASTATGTRRRRSSSSSSMAMRFSLAALLLASVLSVSSSSAASVVVDGSGVDDRRAEGRRLQHASVRGGHQRNTITSTGGKDRMERRALDRGSGSGSFGERGTTAYRILSSEEIHSRLTTLASSHPDLCTLASSQSLYGLPTPTNCVSESCHNWILTIEDKTAHSPGSASHSVLPEVLLSGALHGNERVGPTATVEAAALLLEAADCEATLLTSPGDSCESSLSARGVDGHGRRWLARLVSTRRIVVLPTANALGYSQGVREEDGVDPNRDFPYDLEDYTQCMQTVAGRTVNELFRNHLFQLSLTYHAGMEAIGYEWGNPTPYDGKKKSPDDLAQNELAGGYSRFAGLATGPKTGVYPYGPTNDLVYPVRGGMEDWAYAATFERSLTSPCAPSAYGGYDSAKTTYSDGMLRTFNMLIETSDSKEPDSQYLGTDEDILGGTAGNGHVSRNVRLAINAVEMVEPYVRILGVGDQVVGTDVVPGQQRVAGGCRTADQIAVAVDAGTVDIDWTVGGAFTVDETGVIAVKWDDLPPDLFDCTSQLRQGDLDAFAVASLSLVQSPNPHTGKTHWHALGAHPTSSSKPEYPPGVAVFTQPIDVSGYAEGDEVAVIALAKVDSNWTMQPSDALPGNTPPQSHVVNARTNKEWFHEITDAGGNKKKVQGREVWMSRVVTLKMSPRTLQVSAEAAGCQDVESFVFKSETKTCEWVKNSYTRCRRFGRDKCPKTCNRC